ncbi:general substrate transporter [Fomitiporia mediterranea MF3/22]|uniref:general substrate transporter n=1 Tax=Fomitiporia mediterranea (strain MF3/22) TaxID=694068 RepID=UPI0004408900|nr:general substrate transporter [Fomitiporia mediterranea MF3/22]EJD04682.1 general substrate transporter [Fomitiporia mediterranea MF3/22]
MLFHRNCWGLIGDNIWHIVLGAAVAFTCACSSGYDSSLMTSINGMKVYQDRFNQGNLDVATGIIFSIYTFGQMTGSLWAGILCDKLGRRAGMFAGNVVVLIATAVIASAGNRGQFIAGRFLLGMGISVTIIGAPTFAVEIAPPQWRGRITALYNTGYFGGAIPAAAISLGTERLTTDWSWRIPILVQCIPAIIVMSVVFFLPESPRWLYLHGREEEAFALLTKYHGNDDPNNPIVKLQIEEFKENIKQNASDKRWWDFRALIATHNARWRTLMVLLMGIFGQWSGNGLGYFNLSIYKSLGYNTQMQFNMNLIGQCLNALVAWFACTLEDRMPRRLVLVWGTFGCSLMLAANAGFSATWASYGDGPKNLNIGRAGAAFYILFNLVYAFTYTPLQALYPAECLETTTRAKGLSMKIFVIACTSFISLFCSPIAFGRIGWKYIIVFIFWDAFEAVVWYFLCVETCGYTLEELDEIFSDPNPVKASKRTKKIAIKEKEVILVEDD